MFEIINRQWLGGLDATQSSVVQSRRPPSILYPLHAMNEIEKSVLVFAIRSPDTYADAEIRKGNVPTHSLVNWTHGMDIIKDHNILFEQIPRYGYSDDNIALW